MVNAQQPDNGDAQVVSARVIANESSKATDQPKTGNNWEVTWTGDSIANSKFPVL